MFYIYLQWHKVCVILQINRKQVNKDDSKRSNTKSAAGPFYNAGSKISGFSRRTYAKKFGKTEEAKQFLKILPHQYYEENNLHGLLIEQIKDYELCIEELERFLPHIDNWATCDLLAVRTVKNHLNSYIKKIDRWLESEHIYTIRFGINMLMRYYLEEEFKLEYPGKVAAIRSEEYYVNMARAWYFATALAKKYDQVLPFLEEQKMDVWTHNKTIQKAIESYRITPEQKEYLRTLKIRQ